MKKIVRNMSTPESRAFWADIERSALEIQHWPAWRRAGINVSQFRQEPREASDDATSCDLTSDE